MKLKTYLKRHPRWFDRYVRIRRSLGKKNAKYDFFDAFSKSLSRPARFIQIGANDGLRNDPLREFIVRDRWEGILVEPLPFAFEELKKNYAYLRNDRLIFVHAAVADELSHLDFWTFREDFLRDQPLEKRMGFLRKSSFDQAHVRKFIPDGFTFEQTIRRIEVPCRSLNRLVEKHGLSHPDLLAIDAEGHEAVILRSIDFSVLKPKVIYFEYEHLGDQKKDLYDHLSRNGYSIREIRTDAAAVLSS